jgi:hypothetical protein
MLENFNGVNNAQNALGYYVIISLYFLLTSLQRLQYLNKDDHDKFVKNSPFV